MILPVFEVAGNQLATRSDFGYYMVKSQLQQSGDEHPAL